MATASFAPGGSSAGVSLPEIAWAISLRKRRLSNSPRSRSKNQTKRSSGWGLMASDCPAHRRFLQLWRRPPAGDFSRSITRSLVCPGRGHAYRAVARNRIFFSQVTQRLWGADVRVPTFAISLAIPAAARRRLSGGVLFLLGSAFRIEWSKGNSSGAEFFDRVREILGDAGFLRFLVCCWLGASDAALYAWCGAGLLGRSY